MAPADARSLFRKAKKERPAGGTTVRVRVPPSTKASVTAKSRGSSGLKGLGSYVDREERTSTRTGVQQTPVPVSVPPADKASVTVTSAAAALAAAAAQIPTPTVAPASTGTHESKSRDSKPSVVPEGFFDDRKKDAKIRQVPVKKDDLEEDYAVFQKSVAVKQEKSDKVEAYNDDVAATRRLVGEVHEQETQMDRLRKMKLKYEAQKQVKKEKGQPLVTVKKEEEEDDDDDDDDEDDWRSRGV